ncbi:UDP-N-acetylmuramoylalanyl-D-glutamate--2,6-diaminopimelate ligase [Pedobacter psychrotolerans]|uniref:UDP-N-acetylmuramoyl-L-alanyl-D-glutamate--2,6-diaminopimelate ligase n=1 Tax=Pedobacter psychrotolerans TaxID=1843235 RepID=A0A4R2HLD6_9SPHI|nr:UDP-N-acetylmuramoyl-L-alanyl-D-glutamate--2,6-diaminopimelate ligase [Pedobacter psychrotolerans]TCO30838.1 UDP-N-acetylmuramoylalanyl-D-glutamate--2,6-diaminopimelate ligase [Pedobacter psychrotolerans]GGE44091.1 UDP-N-acetylmuramoyl-L-alanyl-D-glutamate--2,6-diaminopimelate ligase [Pedobacter psychrotolerans]
MQLQDLLYGVTIKELVGKTDREINALNFDSRKVGKEDVFFAVVGTLVDGHQFIEQTITQGATVIVCENLPEVHDFTITYIKVENTAVALGIMAGHYFGNPAAELKLIGITGTNGKTTIATILFKLFKDLGYKTGLISTVENYINDTVIPATHTTPNPIALNQLLSDMVNAGCDYCFMEVSSHAVSQHRIEGLNFSGGVFSNLTHDHLDFHKTFESYLKAKKTFFDMLPKTAFALTNVDDKNGLVMLQNTKAHKKTYALKQLADFKAKIVENGFSGLHLDIDNEDVYFKLIGSFNAYNLLAVYGTAILLEQDKLKVLTSLSRLSGAEGRFDYIVSEDKIIGIVDYAHTPDAVQNVLGTIADIRKGTEQVITVIGCGGDRDKTKRPVMAQVACDWSDKVILTSDNPRTEDPQSIITEMEAGVSPTNKRKTLSILDRREAIKTACHLAKSGDIILIAGKGHEKYQEINGVRNHFDDKEILLEQLNPNS